MRLGDEEGKGLLVGVIVAGEYFRMAGEVMVGLVYFAGVARPLVCDVRGNICGKSSIGGDPAS